MNFPELVRRLRCKRERAAAVVLLAGGAIAFPSSTGSNEVQAWPNGTDQEVVKSGIRALLGMGGGGAAG